MRRVSTSRAFVAGVVMLAMLLSMTVLFGARGSLAKITSPSAKAKVQGLVEVRAEVNSPNVGYVILVVDGDRPGSTNALPASFQLDTRELADGPHKVSVEVYDGFGMIGASKAITIYVKNGAGPLVTAKQPARTRVAAKPVPPATRVTAANVGPRAMAAAEPVGMGKAQAAGAVSMPPMSPARSVAGSAPMGAAKTVAAAEGGRVDSATAPTMLGRGPTPEPTRTFAQRPLLARRAGVAEAGAQAVAAGTRTSLPPGIQMARATPAAYRGHTIMMDGRPVAFDVAPVLKDGRIHGGFRALFGRTGASVTWMPRTRTARSVSEALTVEVPAGSRVARVNGKGVNMGAKAELRDGRTIVPVRFFAQATGSVLAWDRATGIAHLRTPARALAKNTN